DSDRRTRKVSFSQKPPHSSRANSDRSDRRDRHDRDHHQRRDRFIGRIGDRFDRSDYRAWDQRRLVSDDGHLGWNSGWWFRWRSEWYGNHASACRAVHRDVGNAGSRARCRERHCRIANSKYAGDLGERSLADGAKAELDVGRSRSLDRNCVGVSGCGRFATNGFWATVVRAGLERSRRTRLRHRDGSFEDLHLRAGGLLFGLAGVMQMSRLRQGDPTVAMGLELDIIAAVVIGGGSLSGGEGSILGSMIGALIMAFLRNGCQQVGWPNYIQEIIIGALIVFAVAIDRWRHARLSAA